MREMMVFCPNRGGRAQIHQKQLIGILSLFFISPVEMCFEEYIEVQACGGCISPERSMLK